MDAFAGGRRDCRPKIHQASERGRNRLPSVDARTKKIALFDLQQVNG